MKRLENNLENQPETGGLNGRRRIGMGRGLVRAICDLKTEPAVMVCSVVTEMGTCKVSHWETGACCKIGDTHSVQLVQATDVS